MHSIISILLVTNSVLPYVLGYPIADPDIQPRQTVNCTDLSAPFDESCWATLNIEDWLNNPTTGWNKTTPICQGDGPGEDGSACCGATEPWTTCFLRLAHGTPGDDCTVLNTGYCSYDAKLAVNAGIAPEVAYVMKNIYAINNFFSTWYTAMQYATSTVQLTLQPIVSALDQPTTQNYDLNYFLTALMVGLALIPGLDGAALGIDAATVAVGTALLAALQNAPAVAKVLWPAGTQDSQAVQIATLDQYVGGINDAMASNIGAALGVVMGDVPSFVGFAAGGAFSGSSPPSLEQEVEGLDAGVKTYVLTLAMAGNGYQGYSHGTTTAAKFEAGDEGCNEKLFGCSCTLDGMGVCKSSGAFGGTLGGQGFYWDSATGGLYSLVAESPSVGEDVLMREIVGKGWSTLGLVFGNGAACGGGGGGGNPLSLGEDGRVGLGCVSQLGVVAG